MPAIRLVRRLSRLLPNFGLGLYFYNPQKYYVGLFAPQLLNNNLRDETQGIDAVAHQYRQYNFMAGAVFGEELKLRPSVLLKAIPSNAPLQLDASLLFLFKETLWLGASYRTALGNKNVDNQTQIIDTESIDAIVAFQLKNGLKIGYAYDLTLSQLSKYTSGSHEIMLGYDMRPKGVRYHTPRYF